ncbi:hypothetical protein PPERSA_05154 [Pseudocohnilembus persalinus]|uniref:Uncharacterized protein n=1 Tax=Pseudocohnilembus persalinus TaxID=266149 RepID=A0A0V0R9T7_PSEPJ|nr:hypothetical protein PPERSA_05154 [Pseudocohnilembus persalinus]|eukprot:KRX11045.1 hypothetical protein PPERSA_05154 [Pseudocohnilembus persalinus]
MSFLSNSNLHTEQLQSAIRQPFQEQNKQQQKLDSCDTPFNISLRQNSLFKASGSMVKYKNRQTIQNQNYQECCIGDTHVQNDFLKQISQTDSIEDLKGNDNKIYPTKSNSILNEENYLPNFQDSSQFRRRQKLLEDIDKKI